AELVVVQDEPGRATLGGEDVMHPVRLVQCGRRVGRGWFGQRCVHCSTSGELVGHDGCSSITLFCGGATTFSRVAALRVDEPPVATATLAPPLAAQNRRATMRITYSLQQQKMQTETVRTLHGSSKRPRVHVATRGLRLGRSVDAPTLRGHLVGHPDQVVVDAGSARRVEPALLRLGLVVDHPAL